MKFTYSFQRDEEIYRRGDAVAYVYQVVSGSVRILSKLPDGRRQVGAFYFAGEIFGLEPETHHVWSAEAIETTAICRVEREKVNRKAQSNLSYARGVLKITERDLLHAEDHRILLGQLDVTERTAAFFLQMNNRIGVNGTIELNMRTEDIADYLGTTLETVSRSITKLSQMGIVERQWSSRILRILTVRNPRKLRAILPPSYALELPSISETVIRTLFA